MDDFKIRLMKMLTGRGDRGHTLPAEYQEVEYIDNHDAGSYIIPGLTLSGNAWGFKATFKIKTNNTYQAIMSVGGWYRGSLLLGVDGNLGFKLQGFTQGVPLHEYANELITLEANFKNSGIISINGDVKYSGVSASSQSKQTYLLAMHYTSRVMNGCYSEVQEIAFSSGADVTRDLVPARRIIDNFGGMYDLCESVCPQTGTPFYVSAGPNNNFIMGPDLI